MSSVTRLVLLVPIRDVTNRLDDAVEVAALVRQGTRLPSQSALTTQKRRRPRVSDKCAVVASCDDLVSAFDFLVPYSDEVQEDWPPAAVEREAAEFASITASDDEAGRSVK